MSCCPDGAERLHAETSDARPASTARTNARGGIGAVASAHVRDACSPVRPQSRVGHPAGNADGTYP